MHRDYQGSILAITNEAGVILEKRQFDAWGVIGAGNVLNDLNILDRGYTGHEHLQSVGLIHMNGRLYDPKLHRFLQPDDFVQDPSNTENYNRYGDVLGLSYAGVNVLNDHSNSNWAKLGAQVAIVGIEIGVNAFVPSLGFVVGFGLSAFESSDYVQVLYKELDK